ncbi:hypothetical protein SKAU_G00279150 [Synaphobranchus kaupii]|uniref:Endonuclease/exonuclease/phosphatase domain-containing protein n=1 Tax=Synaphobranchus kaupii TaxID=118154 RepID=A0A9Q1EWW0_SYNKA|nr:hypothetical protein SKAU_G00279150 [Synaphobranchus kaupii]
MLKNKFNKERWPLVDIHVQAQEVEQRFGGRGKKRSGLQEEEWQHWHSLRISPTAQYEGNAIGQTSLRMMISRLRVERMHSARRCISGRCRQSAKEPNIGSLQDRMKQTARERDVFIKQHDTKEVLQQYPALRLPAIIFSEMKEKFNIDLDRMILSGFGTMADRIIAEANRRGLGAEMLSLYNRALLSHAEDAHKGLKVTASILLLPYLLNDDPSGQMNKFVKFPSPTIQIEGDPFSDDSHIQLFLDGEELLCDEPEDISMALGVAMGLHFIFETKPPYSMIILLIYRPPKPNPSFLPEISDLLTSLCSTSANIVILWDFNIHVDSPSGHSAVDFLSLLECLNLKQLVKVPTHTRGHILDLVITDSVPITHLQVTDLGVSDHKAVLMELAFLPPLAKSKRCMRFRNWKKISPASLSEDFLNFPAPTSQSLFYSNLIHKNPGNSKHPFSTIDHLLKPRAHSPNETTEEQCKSFIDYLKTKVNNIRSLQQLNSISFHPRPNVSTTAASPLFL